MIFKAHGPVAACFRYILQNHSDLWSTDIFCDYPTPLYMLGVSLLPKYLYFAIVKKKVHGDTLNQKLPKRGQKETVKKCYPQLVL